MLTERNYELCEIAQIWLSCDRSWISVYPQIVERTIDTSRSRAADLGNELGNHG